MKTDVAKRSSRLVSVLERNAESLKKVRSSASSFNRLLLESGILNHSWQTWNGFWRDFWLAEVYGGSDIRRQAITPLHPTLTEQEAVFFLLHGTLGGATPHSQEKSWGSVQVLSQVCNRMISYDPNPIPVIPISVKAQQVAGCLPMFNPTLEDMQLTRNCSIHLDRYNAIRAKTNLFPKYTISDYSYPSDILFCRTLTGQTVLSKWTEDLVCFIQFLD